MKVCCYMQNDFLKLVLLQHDKTFLFEICFVVNHNKHNVNYSIKKFSPYCKQLQRFLTFDTIKLNLD